MKNYKYTRLALVMTLFVALTAALLLTFTAGCSSLFKKSWNSCIENCKHQSDDKRGDCVRACR